MESNTVNWINEYLEWMDPGSSGISATPAISADANMDFVAAYLEWIDSAPSVTAPGRATVVAHAPAPAGIEIYRPEALREAILLMALRTESECVHVLRQVVDQGDATSRTVELAAEAIAYAERLLEDEQTAWRALTALRSADTRQSSVAWQSDLNNSDWPHALEGVMADVRALTGRVLALHTH